MNEQTLKMGEDKMIRLFGPDICISNACVQRELKGGKKQVKSADRQDFGKPSLGLTDIDRGSPNPVLQGQNPILFYPTRWTAPSTGLPLKVFSAW